MNGLVGYRGHLVSGSVLSSFAAGVDQTFAALRRRTLVSALGSVETVGPASAPRHVFELVAVPLLRALAFDVVDDVRFGDELTTARALSSRGVTAGGSCIAVLVPPWGDRLDRFWRAAVVEARRRGAAWAVLCNGIVVRVIDPRRLYSRRYAEFDLTTISERPASLDAFDRVCAAAALLSNDQHESSLGALVARSDAHAAIVCRALRTGVLAAAEEVLSALVASHRTTRAASFADHFEQALTIVYRVLFLLFAEARGLVPLWHPMYRESYSIDALRQAAEAPGPAVGVWDALRAITRMAHAGCHAGDLKVTAFNGRLFSPSRTPLAERRGLDDRSARRAVLALTSKTAADGAGRERIAYGELGVEQLGTVYETLLDYRPQTDAADPGGRRPHPRVSLVAGAGVRKATGTFYTPRTIADYIVRRTLGPLVREAAADDILRLRVVDPAMGSGAFLVAACRYLAAAYEEALIAGGGCHASDFGDQERIAIRRLVAERCLYGVDLNPMAVQLARLSLWLATLAADRPLSFLDHRLISGDSLIGAWLSCLRQRPLRHRRCTGSNLLPLFDSAAPADALRTALPVRFSLESIPNDTVEQVRAKERALDALASRSHALSQWKRIADLWCASWFPGGPPAAAYESLVDRILHRGGALPAQTADGYLAAADAVAASRRFLHWELECPEVFFDGSGERLPRPGFDAVVGNPPWDMMRDDTPAARTAAEAASSAPVVRFTRDSGMYSAQSDGHPNRYQLFVERAAALTRSGGRLGLVLPAGFASDAGSGALRRMLLATCDVDTLVAMDNRRRIFPIHRSMRFMLVTATAGRATTRIGCRFGVEDVNDLPSADEREGFPIRITRDVLDRVGGSSLAIPDLRHPIDLALLDKAASLFAPLAGPAGWNARFGRELNATDDRASFRQDRRGLPVIDGRHVVPFRTATGDSCRSIAAADARRLLADGRYERPRLAYRDVASATNRLTLLAALLPAGCVSTHTLFCLRTPLALADQHLLCGFFNSLVVNYFVRLRVSVHVTTGIVEDLRIPTRDAAPRACREIAAIARRLARRDDQQALARLNAEVARVYQLTREEFEHVLGTFPLVEKRMRDDALEIFTPFTTGNLPGSAVRF